MPRRLTGHLRDRLARTTEILLSPLDYPSPTAWREDVRAAVGDVLRADAVAVRLPLPGLAPHGADALPPALERAYQRAADACAGATLQAESHALLAAVPAAAGPRRPAGLVCRRRITADCFGGLELELLRLLHPAFKAGVAACVELAQRRSVLHAALDGFTEGAAVLDPEGRLLHRNEALAQMPGGEELLRAVGPLVARLGRDVPRRSGGAGASTATEVSIAAGRHRVFATVLAPGSFGHAASILLIVEPRAQKLPPAAVLRQRFGLSAREAEVALLLAQGRRNEHIAAGLAISPHTARHHTEMVLAKLGTRSRAEVGPLLLRV